jgi:hypothetical protein
VDFALLLAAVFVFVAAEDLFFAGVFASEDAFAVLAARFAAGLLSEPLPDSFATSDFGCALTFSSLGFNALGTGIGM